MLTGMNHLTLAVTDLDRSLHFYRDILKMTLHTRWKYGAYLTCGELWICLSADPEIIHRPIHQGLKWSIKVGHFMKEAFKTTIGPLLAHSRLYLHKGQHCKKCHH